MQLRNNLNTASPRGNTLSTLLVAAILAVASPAFADHFLLKNGKQVEGDVVRASKHSYVVRTVDGKVTLRKDAIKRHRPGTIHIKQKGDQGSTNARGYMKQELHRFLKELDAPLQPRSRKVGCAYVLELQVGAKFVKTTKFYGKIPIQDHYTAKAKVVLFAVDNPKKPLVKLTFKHRADLPTSLGRDRALEITRQQLLEELLLRLSKQRFFRDRGATPRTPGQ